jgi:hypothetical protein
MAIDPYAACPGGTGKKVKFCCDDLTGDLEQIDRLIEGDQISAALEQVERLAAKTPGRACLMATQVKLQLATRKFAEAAVSSQAFLAAFPDNPLALGHASVADAIAGRIQEAAAQFDKAREVAGQEISTDLVRIAATLVSREGLSIAKRAIRPGGLVALNTWGIDESRGGPNGVGAAIRATLRQVFEHVLAVPAAGNLLFFASDDPIEPARDEIRLDAFDGPRTFTWLEVPPVEWPAAPILTDDWNPVDTLDVAGLEASRSTRRVVFPEPIRAALAWE